MIEVLITHTLHPDIIDLIGRFAANGKPTAPVVLPASATTEAPVAPPAQRGRPRKVVAEAPAAPAEVAPPEPPAAPPTGTPTPAYFDAIKQQIRVVLDAGLKADLDDGRITRRRDAMKEYLASVDPDCGGKLSKMSDDKLAEVDLDALNAIVTN